MKLWSLHEETSRNLLSFHLILELLKFIHTVYLTPAGTVSRTFISLRYVFISICVWVFRHAKSDDFFCIKTEAWFVRKHWISATGVWISVLDDLRSEWITWIMPLLQLKASIETLNVHLDAQHLWMRYKSGLHFILWLMFPSFQFVAELDMNKK